MAREELKKYPRKTKKRSVLKDQLLFGQKVLGASCDRKLFNFSSQGKTFSPDTLLKKLIAVISSSSVPSAPVAAVSETDYSVPIIVDDDKLDEEMKKMEEKAEKGKRERRKRKEELTPKRKKLTKQMSQLYLPPLVFFRASKLDRTT